MKQTIPEIILSLIIVIFTLFLVYSLMNKYRDLSKRSEIPRNLRRIFENAVNFQNKAQKKIKAGTPSPLFPASSPVTPSISCCVGTKSQKCVPGGNSKTGYSPREWSHDTWKKLHFRLKDPHLYQYKFQNLSENNPGFKAIAIGDLDCDGIHSTYWRRGKIFKNRVEGDLKIYISNGNE